MPLVSFKQLMDRAEAGKYAVGYFESWNLESLLAVADAAEATRSPVILGFSGIYLPHPDRVVADPLSVYAAMGQEMCRKLSVPACLLFNESSHLKAVNAAIDLGFSLVMFSDEDLSASAQCARVKQVCERAHRAGVAVEAEMAALQGMGGQMTRRPGDLRFTDADEARRFVSETRVDALAVNIGQVHLHGRKHVRLDLERLKRLKSAVKVPLVLHGASSVNRADLAAAVRLGIRKINVSSILKQAYSQALYATCRRSKPGANPYEIIGSGLANDVLVPGRLAMQRAVMDLMKLFGSAGQAKGKAT